MNLPSTRLCSCFGFSVFLSHYWCYLIRSHASCREHISEHHIPQAVSHSSSPSRDLHFPSRHIIYLQCEIWDGITALSWNPRRITSSGHAHRLNGLSLIFGLISLDSSLWLSLSDIMAAMQPNLENFLGPAGISNLANDITSFLRPLFPPLNSSYWLFR